MNHKMRGKYDMMITISPDTTYTQIFYFYIPAAQRIEQIDLFIWYDLLSYNK